MTDKKITGNLINAYFICRRKLWLFAHEINPYSENPYLEIGSLIGEEFYKREKKEILTGNIKIDLIKKEDGNLVVAEIKKSSSGNNAAKMQLAFYLYQLMKKNVFAKGELLIPKEKKKIPLELTESLRSEIEKAIEEIKRIISQDVPPPAEKVRWCRHCAYNDFCWA